MKNTIVQENNWNIFKLIDIGTNAERWEFLEQKRGSLLDSLNAIYLEYPNSILGIEIKTLNNNQIVKFN
jgi:hypothetical protein